jgi:hypothetical protein
MVRDAIWNTGTPRLRATRRNNRYPSLPMLAIAASWLTVLLSVGNAAAAACTDASTLAHSTVSITRYFADEEKTGDSDLLGIRGTAWFSSPTSMVTVEHVATAMGLSNQNWKQVEVLGGENKQTINVRLLRLAGSQSEKIAVLELQAPFAGAQRLWMRIEPLTSDEQVAALAYSENQQRLVGGRFVNYGEGDKLAGTALLEMFEGDNRLVIDHGASGAPVVDCEGRVVAVISNIFTQTLQSPFRAIRVSTAWGSPNVVSVPIQVLSEFASVK